MSARTIVVEDDNDALEMLYRRSVEEAWGDGLPFVPPTRERVERALRGVDAEADSVLGTLEPDGNEATVFLVTVNAVMAGCRSDHLPLVFAATEAMCDPAFNLGTVQVTTNPVGVGGFVSGPLAHRAGMNHGSNALGPGNRTNGTIGRALRLVMLNIGGGKPGIVDRATLGQPGKYTFFFGENAADTPWPPWAVSRGYSADMTVVTVMGVTGFMNLIETTDSADELLDSFSVSMASPNSNDYLFAGEPFLVLSPEHARVLAGAGHNIASVQQRLWEQTKLPVRHFSESARRYRLAPTWGPVLGELTLDTQIPLSAKPEDIRIVVAGGAGRHSALLPGFGVSRSCSALADPYMR